ncbi:alkaline phosphatase-like protein [Trematosphaeria pertusa]|uniref:Alkaline phosphatase-like protein n=1 Tax=Trematosphaeria pertusa TaxID=390896 RepID=A0A6A6IC38_9PLEO|nr:alkaline phosphatase-like protein [Trematosphaeria pertusa]KAF2247976.1 alkaline phosphatase-like protein [Trematosphaeria pertusa]
MPDQLRYDSVGFTGRNDIIRTPNLDRFAQMGTRFTNTFSQASVCSQSRCSIFTGQYPHVSGHRSLNNLLKPDEPNLLRTLKEHGGYHIGYLGPRGDLFAANATEHSVDEYGYLENATLPDFASAPDFSAYVSARSDAPSSFNASNPPTVADPDPDPDSIWNRVFYGGLRNATAALDYDERMIRGALDWLECPPQHKPWVLFLPLIFPHPPFEVEEPWFSMYNRSAIPLPAKAEEKTGHEARFAQQIRDQYNTYRATDALWQEVKAVYYGMISRVDDQFGRIMNKTIERGLWNNTVTLFFTDHGEFLGDWGLVEKWPSAVSENLVHEPLIIGGAGLPEGVVYEEMAEMVDLVPTMLQLGSTGEFYAHYGLSLVDAMHAAGRNETLPHKQYAFTEGGFLTSEEPLLEQGPYPYDIKTALQHDDTELVGKAVSIRDQEFTYVYRLYEADELYLRDDTSELRNLAADPAFAGVRQRMRDVVMRWMVETADTLPWYQDVRVPQVRLQSPKEQFEERVPESPVYTTFLAPLGRSHVLPGWNPLSSEIVGKCLLRLHVGVRIKTYGHVFSASCLKTPVDEKDNCPTAVGP